MQTLRKKGSPCKYRNDPGRFFGEGVVFKAKLIGILEVGEARGDRMCQEALQDLKVAIRAAGEHKQRITIHVTIDGLRLRDEKTGDSLYHHPVHKISFIAQDMTDSRAFGYIFGSPDSGHRFFGIKTDKAASQVVLAMRDLFQVVFELKKKEIELARQTIQTKAVMGGSSTTGGGASSSVHHSSIGDKLKDRNDHKLTSATKSNFMDDAVSFMHGASGGGGGGTTSQMGDLVDLEQELSSIQRGITQMEKMTPNEGPNKLDSDDPFGDSFANSPNPSSTGHQFNILPPPPSSENAKSRHHSTKSQQMAAERKENDWSPPLLAKSRTSVTDNERPSINSPNPTSDSWLNDDNVFDNSGNSGKRETNSTTVEELEREFLNGSGRDSANNSQQSKEDSGKFADAFIDLDPLGTGKNKPYVDKKFFFQDVKNPPKKVLKELSSSDVNFMATFQHQQQQQQLDDELNSSTESTGFGGNNNNNRQRKTSSEEEHRYSEQTMFSSSGGRDSAQQSCFEPFEDPFELVPKVEPAVERREEPQQQQQLFRRPSGNNSSLSVPLKVILPPETNRSGGSSSRGSTPRNRSPNLVTQRYNNPRKSSYESTRRIRNSPDYSDAPEPPPRPDMSHYADPPPLPPKKSFGDVSIRTSNRPSLSNFKLSMSPRDNSAYKGDSDAPPLPLPSRKIGHSDSKFPGPERPQKQEEDGYLLPTSPNVPVLLPPPKAGSTKRSQQQKRKEAAAGVTNSAGPLSPGRPIETTTEANEITEITLSQLLQLSLDELADKLNVSAQKLSTMTIVELTKYLSEFLSKEKDEKRVENSRSKMNSRETPRSTEPNVFKVSFDDDKDATFVAVFDDNFGEDEEHQQQQRHNLGMNDFVADFDNANIQMASQSQEQKNKSNETNSDRYAVLREIFDEELKSDRQQDLLSGEDLEPPAEGDYDNASAEEEADDRKMGENVMRVPPKIDTSITATISHAKDRYAALRDIVLVENLFEAAPVKEMIDMDSPPPPSQPVATEMTDEAEPTTMMSDEHFVSDNFGDFDEEKTITSSQINVESPEHEVEEEERTDYELKDKSCTPTFVSARDDLEIDELMNLAVSNLSLNNINSLSPKTTELQLKHASTSPIFRGQQGSPAAAMVIEQKTIDTSTSPIIMQMTSPVAFERSSPRPSTAPITVVTPPVTADGEKEEKMEQDAIGKESGEVNVAQDKSSPVPQSKPEEKWTAFEETPPNVAKRMGGGKPPLLPAGDQHVESPCSSDDKDELKVLNRKWPKGHTSSSSRDASPRDPSPWDDEFGEGRRRVSPGLSSDRQGHYMRHGRRMDSCDEDYENDYDPREGGRWTSSAAQARDNEQWHYSKYGDRGNYPGSGGQYDDRHRDGGMKTRSGRSYEKRKFYSSHGRKTYDYGDVGRGGGGGGDTGLPFDIGAPVRPTSGGSRDRMKREYYGSRERRSFDRESNDSYDSGSGGGPVRKPRRDYRNEYYGSIELMPDEYELDVNKKRYASLEKGHKTSLSRRSSGRRSQSDAYDDVQDESEEGDCPNNNSNSSKSPHYSRPYITEGSKSLQRGMNRMQQGQIPPSALSGNSKSRKAGGSSPWDSKPSPIYNNKISWSAARPSSASEAGGAAMDRHRYFSTQALSVGCSDSEKERRQRLKGGRGGVSSSTVQLTGPQSAGGGRRYGNEFTFEEENAFHTKGVMRKSLRGSREAAVIYNEELNDGGGGGGMMRGSSRKVNMSMDHQRYERTNSRPQPMDGKYYQPQRGGGGDEDEEEYDEEEQQHYHPHYQYHGQMGRRTVNEETVYVDRGERGGVGEEEEQGFESDFIASSPIKSSGSLKSSRPVFRFATDYSNNNSPGVESSASGGGGQNGSQPRLRFNEKVKVSNYKANYMEGQSDSLESPPERILTKDQFEDDFSNLTPEHMDEMGDQWDENFTAPTIRGGAPKEKDIRKSESVNIFAKKSDDPFEDDDFFKTEEEEKKGNGAAAGTGENFNWNHNFAKFED